MTDEHLDKYQELISEVLAQAVEDFIGLRSRNVIRKDYSVDSSKWIHRDDGSMQKPLNIDSPTEALELIWFFQSNSLDRLCAFVGIPACRIRTKLGFKPEAVIDRDLARSLPQNLHIEDKPLQKYEISRYRF
jgi:hypothetical protein